MAKKGRYIVSHSNYTIRKKHQSVQGGTIYERDYMITNGTGMYPSDTYSYGHSNFKFVNRYAADGMRRRQYGDWLKKEECKNQKYTTGEYWHLSCLDDTALADEDVNSIVLKPDYTDLLSFAYYGGCEEMIRTSLNKIANRFPAEVYVTDKYRDISVDGNIKHLGDDIKETLDTIGLDYSDLLVFGDLDLREVSNPFMITFIEGYKEWRNDSSDNSLRYFPTAATNYNVLDTDTEVVREGAVCDVRYLKSCRAYNNGDLVSVIVVAKDIYAYQQNMTMTLFAYSVGSGIVYLCDKHFSGYRLRPNDESVTEFEDSLTLFEKMLLNRNTLPLYTSRLQVPSETDEGISYTYRNITWPSLYDWNIDTYSTAYGRFINSLLEIATFLDEGYSDNLWNIMTHESIKNMDRTFVDNRNDDDSEDYQLGVTRLKDIFMVYGRMFDELKMYIDNIIATNTVTYNQYANLPDYFLSDSLELAGWEVSDCTLGLVKDNYISNMLSYETKYTFGEDTEFGLVDVNKLFMNNLRLNSKAVFSRKGNRECFEMIFGMFGFKSYDLARQFYNNLPKSLKYSDEDNGTIYDFDTLYSTVPEVAVNLFDYRFDESVMVADELEKVGADEELNGEKYNKMKATYTVEDDSNYEDTMQGIPCAIVNFVDSDNKEYKYIIPWFSKVSELDGSPYFQMYGGWGALQSKFIDNTLAPSVKEIESVGTTVTKDVPQTDTYTVSELEDGAYTTTAKSGDYFDYEVLDTSKGKHLMLRNDKQTKVTINSTNVSYTFMLVDKDTDVIKYKNVVSKTSSKVTKDISSMTNYNVVLSFPDGNMPDSIVFEYLDDVVSKGFTLYDESIDYMGVVKSVGDLSDVDYTGLHGNDVYYVYNVSDFDNYFGTPFDDTTMSHYFICYDADESAFYGSRGWKNIPLADITGKTGDGLRVLYLESIIDDNKGNNPHVGYGNYDGGEEYLNFFRQVFYYSINNNNFNDPAHICSNGEIKDEIKNYGFDIVRQTDNMKCWYFSDTSKDKSIVNITKKISDIYPPVGKYCDKGRTTKYTELDPNNFEGGYKNDEAAANSIINIKPLNIVFNSNYADNETFRKFLQYSVMRYVKQIIPSTTIWSLSIEESAD